MWANYSIWAELWAQPRAAELVNSAPSRPKPTGDHHEASRLRRRGHCAGRNRRRLRGPLLRVPCSYAYTSDYYAPNYYSRGYYAPPPASYGRPAYYGSRWDYYRNYNGIHSNAEVSAM